jgi:hypothetical protein
MALPPIRYFQTIEPARIVDALNELVNDINARIAEISGDGAAILTGQVQKAAISLFPANPPASWPDFVSQYVGDEIATDETYQTVFVTSEAPISGEFWQLMDTYFQTSCGFTSGQSTALLTAIWALAPTLPL